MKISTEPFQLADQEGWDSFVESCGLGTLFSTVRFYQYHDEPKPVECIRIEINGRTVAAVAGSRNGDTLYSPVAASYGGLLLQKGASFKKKAELVARFLAWAKSTGIKSITFTFPPLVYSTFDSEEDFFLLQYHGFKPVKTLLSSVLDLSKGAPRYGDSLKNHLVNAEKLGLSARPFTSLDSFYPMLVENKKVYNQLPVHSTSELVRLQNLFPEKLFFRGVFCDGDLLAGTMIMVCKPDIWLFFYIASSEQGREMRAVPALIDAVIKEAAAKRIRLLDFGVSHETAHPNPMEPKYSLIHFKEGFGARGVQRFTFKWTAVDAL